MKLRYFKPLFLFVMIICLLVTNSFCRGNVTVQAEEPSKLVLTIAQGYGATLWLLYAEAIARYIQEERPESLITTIPGGCDTNISLLQKGEVDFAISAADSANNAIHGWESFSEPVSLESVATVACLHFGSAHFVILDNLDLKSIEEIKDKKFPLKLAVGRRGDGGEMAARRILAEYGINYEDIEKWGGKIVYFGFEDATRMMADGKINALIIQSVVPLTPLTELSMKRAFKILPIRDGIIEELANEFNYTIGIIPAGSYKGVTEDIPTICVANGLFANANLDEDTVYLVTRAILNNMASFRQVHNLVKDITTDFMEQEIVFPLHPGAKRAYQELE